VAVAVNAIRKALPHIFIFREKKCCLQDILFVVYLQLALKDEINHDDKHEIFVTFMQHFVSQIKLSRKNTVLPGPTIGYKLVLTRAIRLG